MYLWLYSSLLLLLVWSIIFISHKSLREEMLKTSLFTMLLGFTEPLFVPEYWLPKSLFNLAARTGFDLESFIFAFALGGLAVIFYEAVTKIKHLQIPKKRISREKIRLHRLLLLLPVVIFIIISLFSSLNPIYPTIISLMIGGLGTILCRPDLWKKIVLGGLIFFCFYFCFFLVIVSVYPNFVRETWNLAALSGIVIFGIPLEELLFALGVGFMWSGIYEHLLWIRVKPQKKVKSILIKSI